MKARLEQRIEKLLVLLRESGLKPTAAELAETLWLAAHLSPTPARTGAASPDSPKEPPAPAPEAPSGQSLPPAGEAATLPRRPPALPATERRAALYPRTEGVGGRLFARPFRAPAVPLLPEALALGRALRPLHRKFPSRIHRQLDEEATAERAAEQRVARQGAWYPVLRRAQERWFDLALVIDRGASMAVWQPLLVELRRLLTYNGAFRTVRVWDLDTDAEEARLRAGADPANTRACQPQELIAPEGRRLILVMSDCISRAWHTGSVNALLRLWTPFSPVAVVQMLPPRMWPGTALGRGTQTRLFAAAPGIPADRLRPDSAAWTPWDDDVTGDETRLNGVLKLPVLSLEANAWLGWASLLNGKRSAWTAGVLFDTDTRYAVPVPDAPAIDKAVRQFFAQASPLAQRLAGYLAAAPLTLPVMRLVQEVMLPESGQVHLAEVFVSGLLKKHPAVSAEEKMPFYDFREGVRERLLDLIGTSEAVLVLREVSEFVARHTDRSLDFQALLADPTASGDFTLDAHARYFAILGAKVLRRLGGPYRRLADRLEGRESVEEAPAESEASIDAVKVFLSYAHEDRTWLKRLEAHLASLKRLGLIDIWSKREMGAGEEWPSWLEAELSRADLVLFLVSPSFLASAFTYDVEMKRALDRRRRSGNAWLVPIILELAPWESTPLAELACLPADGRPIASRPDPDAALAEVVEGLRPIIEELRVRRTTRPPLPPIKTPQAPPRVFISYAQFASAHAERVLALARALADDGLDVELDQFHAQELIDWPRWCEERLSPEHTDFVLMVCSDEYRQRIEGRVELDQGRGVFWEGNLISDYLHREKANERFVPLLLDDESEAALPSIVANRNWFRLRGLGLDSGDEGYKRLYRLLTNQPTPERVTRMPSTHIHISMVPDPLEPSIGLIGRDEELERLKESYQNEQPTVLCVHGPVGSGKTFLMSTFVNDIVSLRHDHDEVTVFWWSFPSKESPESPDISSTEFFAKALPCFGHEGKLPESEMELRQRLAELLQKRKSLLILDQVENLQQPRRKYGKIKDWPLRELLHELALRGLESGGLVLVGSRYPLIDLKAWEPDGKYSELELKPLKDDAGATLLRRTGVHAPPERGHGGDALQAVNREMGGNPLALLLVGSLISKKFNGDVSSWDTLRSQSPSILSGSEGGKYASKAIMWYDTYLNTNERTFMRLLGLFSREMKEDEFKVLLGSAAGRSLAEMGTTERNEMYSDLSDYNLLSGEVRGHRWIEWDTHTLVRAYFGEQLREKAPEAWRDAHRVLFEHYSNQEYSKSPDLVELTSMFGVIRHGCLAKQGIDAYKFYRYRIAQDWKGYDTEVHGAVSKALNAISSFFEDDLYQNPVGELGDLDKAWLLSRASYCLECQGKLRDAVVPREESNRIFENLYSIAREASYEAFERARDAAFSSEVLAVIQRRLGALKAAEDTARGAVRWADVAAECENRSQSAGTWIEPKKDPDHMPSVPSWLRQCSTHSALGSVLHRRGKLNDAWEELEKAHQIHDEHMPEWVLHSEPGVRYCMLRLDRARTIGELDEVRKHADKMLDWSNEFGAPDATETIKGLHCLIKGRALMELGHYAEALETLDEAVQLVRYSNRVQFLCDPLLARATAWRLNNRLGNARIDVERVLSISHEYEMRLYLADGYLLSGHIALDSSDTKTAYDSLTKARDLIGRENDDNCYRLRIPELHLLKARLNNYDKNAPRTAVQKCLDDARKSFEAISYWRLHWQLNDYRAGHWAK